MGGNEYTEVEHSLLWLLWSVGVLCCRLLVSGTGAQEAIPVMRRLSFIAARAMVASHPEGQHVLARMAPNSHHIIVEAVTLLLPAAPCTLRSSMS